MNLLMQFPKIRLLANAIYTAVFSLLSAFCIYAALKLWQEKTWAILVVCLFLLAGALIGTVYSYRLVLAARKTIREKAAARAIAKYRRPAAEQLNAKDTAKLLMEVFHFTPEELALNQSGIITENQRRPYYPPLSGFVKMIILFVIVVGLILLGIDRMATTGPTEKQFASGFVIVLSVIGLVLDLRSRWRLARGQLSSACGSVTLKVNQPGDIIEHCAVIDGKTFTIAPWQYDALVEGRPYCFYFMEIAGYTRGKIILSVSQQ